MKVENKLIDKWNKYKEHGDITLICDQYKGQNRTMIGDAFKTGEMSEETFTAINSFYAERHKRVIEASNKLK